MDVPARPPTPHLDHMYMYIGTRTLTLAICDRPPRELIMIVATTHTLLPMTKQEKKQTYCPNCSFFCIDWKNK